MQLISGADPSIDGAFPWDLAEISRLPARNREELLHAQNFSESIHGAALLYNLMLAELRAKEDLVARYIEELGNWDQMCRDRAVSLSEWDLEAFWDLLRREGARIPTGTRSFVSAWVHIVRRGLGQSWRDSEPARTIIHQRERVLKRRQARLDGGTALELWGGAAGTGRLDFRWGRVARQFIRDVTLAIGNGDARSA